ncbi:YlbF family regulator [Agrilactobacillus fermenti]|uniref:YlbF family regulator n=1 Tax=Agrilactobacillus fermenti TaxID=2586909 RepID=UPI001E60C80E|nr:YlbF family regulator [Agrilactobacillus fermenti]MCD2255265.1 YlbF family regulator [Agrilactobacillus fermenti]
MIGLIYDEHMAAVEDSIDHLVEKLAQSKYVTHYQQKLAALQHDLQAQVLIDKFHSLQQRLSQVEPYGAYRPEVMTLKQTTLAAKRAMDLNQQVAAYKLAQRELETVIDTIAVVMANSVSKDIKVATQNPFFETKRRPHNKLER